PIPREGSRTKLLAAPAGAGAKTCFLERSVSENLTIWLPARLAPPKLMYPPEVSIPADVRLSSAASSSETIEKPESLTLTTTFGEGVPKMFKLHPESPK